MRKRKDGRWEYRKMQNGITQQIYASNQKELLQQIRKIKVKNKSTAISKVAIDLIWEWYNKFKTGLASQKIYMYYIKAYFEKSNIFKKTIDKLTYSELQDFLLKITKHRVATYCYYIIKGIFEFAEKSDLIKKDISKFLEKPKNKTVKGVSFTLQEQKDILQNLGKTPIGNQILFYLLTGCRRDEAKNISIDFEKLSIYVVGTKTEHSKRYLPISQRLAEILKTNTALFSFKGNYYSRKFNEYLKLLNIKGKSLHDLRHTYSTNLYYLGVPDKQRQYYLGHSSIVITNDIYTTLDPTISRQEILDLYRDLYPVF